MSLEILPVVGMGDVVAGDDLATLIAGAAPWLRDGDVLVVTSKIVSKAEGRLVEVPADGPEREAARAEVLAAESARVVARRGQTTIVQTHHGFVMASAGIDASNVDKTHLVLLPADPDASARRLRAAFAARGLDVAVIISDTMGRAWRNGLTDVALGAAGIAPLRDHRGEVDPYGNELHITQMAVVDELAAAGELVKGKRDQVPVAVVRGQPWGSPEAAGAGAAALVRDGASDMFSLGTAEARADGLRAAATLPDTPAGAREAAGQHAGTPGRAGQPAGGTGRAGQQAGETGRAGQLARTTGAAGPDAGDGVAAVPAAVRRALALVGPHLAGGTALHPEDGGVRCVPPGTGARELVRFGADVHRVRAALLAEGVATTVADTDGDAVLLTTAAV